MRSKVKSFFKNIINCLFEACYAFLMLPAGRKPGRKPFDKGELRLAHRALLSQNLFSQNGKMVIDFEKEFSGAYGVPYAVACSSGTAAIHTALGALDLNPGDEVITAPITDMGTIVPILYQNAIPVFSDINDSCTMDPEDIEQKINPRTRAILLVHLFGNTCDMDPIMDIARRHNIPVIEDCAQAHMTEYKQRYAGTIGDIGCFSFQQAKHMTTGDGGMAITSNKAYYEKMKLFVDKNYARKGWGARAYYGLAPNYRMNELTAAVGLAQLKKVKRVVKKRHELGTLMNGLLRGHPEIGAAPATPGTRHSFWLYPFTLKTINADIFAKELIKGGLKVLPGYTVKPIYLCSEALTRKKTYGRSQCPFSCENTARTLEYKEGICPNAEDKLRHLICVPMDESWDKKRVEKAAGLILESSSRLNPGSSVEEIPGLAGSIPDAVLNGPSRRVRTAIVGCGKISKWHVEAYKNNPGVELSAFVDKDLEKAEALARKFNGKAFDSHKALLSGLGIQAASICTFPSTHKQIALDLLEAGINVLCEKPLSISAQDAEEMTSKAKEKDLLLLTAYKFRFFEEVRKAKDLLSRGGLGRIVNFRLMFSGYLDMSESWFSDKDFSGGGVIIDNGSHALDLVRHLLGDIVSVSARTGKFQDLKVEDTAGIQVILANGGSGTIDVSWSGAVPCPFYFEIYGEDGAILLETKGISYRFKTWADWKNIPNRTDTSGAFNLQINHFIDSVNGKKPSVITPEDGLKSQMLIDSVYEALSRKDAYAAA
ncbi:MAG: aminotransferase class V-fold PLP-dependent enzyme [Candidatus Omnitrophica bacterium]|nr:aminotransferase class V-fold PLP-dependent enzyme [Candidatus Omnitrophota bacterium]MDD5553456.1 aminotransferase class V-fold PLP-dependent enzyme [Candidatus Omnitrophota bacterium]